jgi:hypothetical protein
VNKTTSRGGESCGWFKACRTREPLEIIKKNPSAFILAYIIAARAWYTVGFNAEELGRGEAMLGDFENYGMSERQYRTAKGQLEKWGFATFKMTSKGTIGKLIDTRLFNPLNISSDGQDVRRLTSNRRTADGQPTTNKKDKKEINQEGGESISPNGDVPSQEGTEPPRLTASERISKEQELNRASRELIYLGKASEYDEGHGSRKRIKELRAGIEILKNELGTIA